MQLFEPYGLPSKVLYHSTVSYHDYTVFKCRYNASGVSSPQYCDISLLLLVLGCIINIITLQLILKMHTYVIHTF